MLTLEIYLKKPLNKLQSSRTPPHLLWPQPTKTEKWYRCKSRYAVYHKKKLTFSWKVPLCLCEGRSSVWARRKCQRWNLMVQFHHSVEEKPPRQLLAWQLYIYRSNKQDRFVMSDLSTRKAQVLQSLKDPLLRLPWCKCPCNAVGEEDEDRTGEDKRWVNHSKVKRFEQKMAQWLYLGLLTLSQVSSRSRWSGSTFSSNYVKRHRKGTDWRM